MKKAPKIVIAGAGFGGLAAAKELANCAVDVTVLDRSNHHLFQPLLYQVATAALSPAQIAQPIRHILRDARNITVAMTEIVEIRPDRREVVTKAGVVSYDYLIVATGARHSYFGHPEWEKDAPGLKSIDDALEIRRRMLFAFEEAEMLADPEARKAALTFIVVGAGPTGVEMAGSIAEIARYTMVQDFRRIDPSEARVILLDAAPRVLPAFAEPLSAKAEAQLRKIGVEVHTGKGVKTVNPEGVQLEDRFIPSRTVIWAAGNAASPLGKQLGAETDRAGRVVVEPDLTVPGHPNVFVIGDMASFSHQGGQPLPGVSPVAMQQGRYAARKILAELEGRDMRPFHYVDKGSMATIGRHAAVADLRGLYFNGFAAWLAWLFVHLIFLVGFRARILVFIQWVWSYINYYRGVRLITGRTRQVGQPREEQG
ncbi:MAG TPA: NAD(P)/FAD-dependent oxidoreductase [Chthoniobacteraceae bacterium]|nr:NAD(P)/FAD-dependent oxidoreductase [Chthoniobacteraceae bacterium]